MQSSIECACYLRSEHAQKVFQNAHFPGDACGFPASISSQRLQDLRKNGQCGVCADLLPELQHGHCSAEQCVGIRVALYLFGETMFSQNTYALHLDHRRRRQQVHIQHGLCRLPVKVQSRARSGRWSCSRLGSGNVRAVELLANRRNCQRSRAIRYLTKLATQSEQRALVRFLHLYRVVRFAQADKLARMAQSCSCSVKTPEAVRQLCVSQLEQQRPLVVLLLLLVQQRQVIQTTGHIPVVVSRVTFFDRDEQILELFDLPGVHKHCGINLNSH